MRLQAWFNQEPTCLCGKPWPLLQHRSVSVKSSTYLLKAPLPVTSHLPITFPPKDYMGAVSPLLEDRPTAWEQPLRPLSYLLQTCLWGFPDWEKTFSWRSENLSRLLWGNTSLQIVWLQVVFRVWCDKTFKGWVFLARRILALSLRCS